MKQIVITEELAAKGMRVKRGPDWNWENQDGWGLGTIIEEPRGTWVSVKWDSGGTYTYRVGDEGKYDLAMYDPFITSGINLTNSSSNKVQAVRESLSASIQKSQDKAKTIYQTEKSITNYEHRNTSHTDSGAIKVRRPIIKIQGAKR